MFRFISAWLGTVATGVGRSSNNGRDVRVMAEAVAGGVVVEASGKHGVPVRFPAERENLKPMQLAWSIGDSVRRGLEEVT